MLFLGPDYIETFWMDFIYENGGRIKDNTLDYLIVEFDVDEDDILLYSELEHIKTVSIIQHADGTIELNRLVEK